MHANPTRSDLTRLIQKLRQVQATLPAEILPLIDSLTQLLKKLSAGSALDSLKKPGAWFDVPLPPTSVDEPYYVRTPVQIEVVNVSSPELTIDLFQHPALPADGGSLVTIPAPSR